MAGGDRALLAAAGKLFPPLLFFTLFFIPSSEILRVTECGWASSSPRHLLHPGMGVQDPSRTPCTLSPAPRHSGGFAFSVCFRALQSPHGPAFPVGLGELVGMGVPVSARGRCHPSFPSCPGMAVWGDTGRPLLRAWPKPPFPRVAAQALLRAGRGWAFPTPEGGWEEQGESLGTLGGPSPGLGWPASPCWGGQRWQGAGRAPEQAGWG